jgi:hypothetical protein
MPSVASGFEVPMTSSQFSRCGAGNRAGGCVYGAPVNSSLMLPSRSIPKKRSLDPDNIRMFDVTGIAEDGNP